MSDVKRYKALGGMLPGKGWGDGVFVAACDYDALAQRCRELEACIAGDHTNLVALLRVGQAQAERERDTLRAEVAQLRSLPARLQQIVTTRHESTAALAARVRDIIEGYQ